MKRIHRIACCTLSVLLVLILVTHIGPVEAQTTTTPHLTVTLSGQTMTAGFNNNVTVNVLNNYYSVIYDVDVALSIPTGLTLYGDSHWHYSSIEMGQSVTIQSQVYAPIAAIGSTYQGSVTVTYKQLGDISYTQEVHDVSFSVQGWIKLVLYGVQLTPSITTPGGNATISGNLLNSGNLAAYNANVTVESDVLVPSTISSAYLGEIDPNIPRPFSLLVVFKGNVAEGNYSITVTASAIDSNRPASPYRVQATSNIQLRRAAVSPTQRRGTNGGVVGILLQVLRYLMDVFFGSASPFSLGYSFPLSALNSGQISIRLPMNG
jgi:uncharacterized membrane protein